MKNNRSKNNRSKKSGTKKGQFFSYDAIVAGALFAILLTILFVYWSSIRSFIFTQAEDMFRRGVDITDSLLTVGNPVDWTTNDVNKVGLVDEWGSVRINETKLGYLQAMLDPSSDTYGMLRSKFGAAPYELYITLNSTSSSEEAGNPPLNPTGKITVKRQVIYNGKPANFSVTIWSSGII